MKDSQKKRISVILTHTVVQDVSTKIVSLILSQNDSLYSSSTVLLHTMASSPLASRERERSVYQKKKNHADFFHQLVKLLCSILLAFKRYLEAFPEMGKARMT